MADNDKTKEIGKFENYIDVFPNHFCSILQKK